MHTERTAMAATAIISPGPASAAPDERPALVTPGGALG